ncbi:dihydropteroate synthase [Legionella fairfieldensis]|uniref:dihydropteroate synthase n=1 Tax=Legionella fairfieldensis TaxID=45064 RepID=UPI00048F693F|nr:dihydropteroate synthase [Legionella fairfieldensis]
MNTEQFKQWCEFYSHFPLKAHQQQSPLIMGILNVTPDSFSDGGYYYEKSHALVQARKMIAAGADIIDIGGESSRPGATRVNEAEELERVVPVIEQLRAESDICISIDTTKPQVMSEAVYAGAAMINDITALRNEEALVTAAELDVPVCLMHMQGEPQTMQKEPQYAQGVIHEVNRFFTQRIQICLAAGIKPHHIILDPGFGFGKMPVHNLQIVGQFTSFQQHQLPLMLGVSRKSTLGMILDSPVNKRLAAGLAVAVFTALQGVAIIRTHDVAETKQALEMVNAICEAGKNKVGIGNEST